MPSAFCRNIKEYDGEEQNPEQLNYKAYSLLLSTNLLMKIDEKGAFVLEFS